MLKNFISRCCALVKAGFEKAFHVFTRLFVQPDANAFAARAQHRLIVHYQAQVDSLTQSMTTVRQLQQRISQGELAAFQALQTRLTHPQTDSFSKAQGYGFLSTVYRKGLQRGQLDIQPDRDRAESYQSLARTACLMAERMLQAFFNQLENAASIPSWLAFHWLVRLASLDSPEAQYRLAKILESKPALQQLAIVYYARAAHHRVPHAEACLALAAHYQTSLCVPPHLPLSVSYLFQAALAGNSKAQADIERLLEEQHPLVCLQVALQHLKRKATLSCSAYPFDLSLAFMYLKRAVDAMTFASSSAADAKSVLHANQNSSYLLSLSSDVEALYHKACYKLTRCYKTVTGTETLELPPLPVLPNHGVDSLMEYSANDPLKFNEQLPRTQVQMNLKHDLLFYHPQTKEEVCMPNYLLFTTQPEKEETIHAIQGLSQLCAERQVKLTSQLPHFAKLASTPSQFYRHMQLLIKNTHVQLGEYNPQDKTKNRPFFWDNTWEIRQEEVVSLEQAMQACQITFTYHDKTMTLYDDTPLLKRARSLYALTAMPLGCPYNQLPRALGELLQKVDSQVLFINDIVDIQLAVKDEQLKDLIAEIAKLSKEPQRIPFQEQFQTQLQQLKKENDHAVQVINELNASLQQLTQQNKTLETSLKKTEVDFKQELNALQQQFKQEMAQQFASLKADRQAHQVHDALPLPGLPMAGSTRMAKQAGLTPAWPVEKAVEHREMHSIPLPVTPSMAKPCSV